MAPKRAKQHRSALRTFGEKPFTGRRFVSKGKVRIEWTEGSRRRTRTIGPDSPEVRAEADAEIERILSNRRAQAAVEDRPEAGAPPGGVPSVLPALRLLALAIIDAADRLIDRVTDDLSSGRD